MGLLFGVFLLASGNQITLFTRLALRFRCTANVRHGNDLCWVFAYRQKTAAQFDVRKDMSRL